jgi:hypothetical protein
MRPLRRQQRHRVLAGFALVVLAAGLGCRPYVENLKPESSPLRFRPLSAYQLTVGVTGPDLRGAGASGGFEEGFADFLANEQIFSQVVYPYADGRDAADLILKVDAQGDFRSGGAKNFFTWFPGGLVFAPAFRGTRWYYDTRAEVEVLEARTKQPFAKYSAATSHVVVHRSAAPGPLITAIIIPAVIQGAKNTKPRRNYSTLIFKEAFGELWKQVAGQMLAQEGDYLAMAQRGQSAPRYTQGAPPPPSPSPARPSAAPAPPARVPPAPGVEYEDFYSRQVAVVVGIDQYASWPTLTGATSDARRMAEYLRSSGFDQVIEIYDGEATRQRLLQVLGNELGEHVDPDSLALIYFAGHGQTETLPGGSKRGYLIPVDADDDVFASGISMETVRDLSNRMTAKHVLYAIDACYSGLALTRGIAIPQKTSGYLSKVTQMRAVQILAAGSEGEQAVEVGGQGLFTTYLLRALQGEADLDGDGAVTAREIANYVRPQVTVASDARQTPQFGTIEGAGEVVFLPAR